MSVCQSGRQKCRASSESDSSDGGIIRSKPTYHPCQNPTYINLNVTQPLTHSEIWAVILAVADCSLVLLSQRCGTCYRGLLNSILSDSTPLHKLTFHFQTWSLQLQPTLTQMTSLEAIYQISRSYKKADV